MSLEDPLTVENIERVIETHEIDAVLATSLVAGKIGARARNLESREASLAIVTGPIAERLRKDGLIR